MTIANDRPEFSTTQHCRNDECYSFSHTAQWCNREQPEFCPCPFDYAAGLAERINAELRGEVDPNTRDSRADEEQDFSFEERAMGISIYAAAHQALISDVEAGDPGLVEVIAAVAYFMRRIKELET